MPVDMVFPWPFDAVGVVGLDRFLFLIEDEFVRADRVVDGYRPVRAIFEEEDSILGLPTNATRSKTTKAFA